MSIDSVTVRSSQSWFSRIGGAIAGVLVGVILFVVAFPLLGWNEGRAIKRAKTLEAGDKAVVSVPAAPVEDANEGKLVHLTGKTVAGSEVSDTVFGITEPVIKLRRIVEMYQWTEEKKTETKSKTGGSEETVTTYSYNKEWATGLVDSSAFQKTAGHENPDSMPIEGETFVTDSVTVGDFILPDSLIEKIDDFESLPITKDTKTELSSDLPEPIAMANGGFYAGKNPKSPAIGDLKISFEIVKPGDVSIVAGQTGKTFEPYIIENLGEIELLQVGTFSSKSMFATEQTSNTIITWLLRFVGFIMMFVGLALIAKPITVIADIIPLFGSIAGMGVGLLSFLIALPLTLGTISIAWLFYRPLLGIPLLLLAVAGIVLAVRTFLKKKRALRPPPMTATA